MHARIQEFAPMSRPPRPLRPADRLRRCRSILSLEQLEDRVLLKPAIQVTNNLSSGSGSLQQAIIDANNGADLDTIVFDLESNESVIKPILELPAIDHEVIIDGHNTNPSNSAIVLDGSLILDQGNPIPNVNGLT